MTLNLLTDPWIPVVRNGEISAVCPHQIAEPNVTGVAWDRPDFNLACLELLIGLVSMADPPCGEADWASRVNRPSVERLQQALATFAQHFFLDGDGPRFLQDLEEFDRTAKPSDIKPVDMLFVDSAGDSTASKNGDLMVKRNRFDSLSQPEAAMALYTLQAFAPSGGAGNRTSMRGGGPLTTLVHPIDAEISQFGLWRIVASNVLPGSPLSPNDAPTALPWLRPTRTSENGQIVSPQVTHPLEAFFGMPRRIRLVFSDDQVVGAVQRPYGTNYAAWDHPLTPYYRKKEDDPNWLPVHPKAGRLNYRNWMGITLKPSLEGRGTKRTAKAVQVVQAHNRAPDFELLVGGWAMDNMKPVNFSLDKYPGFPSLDDEGEFRIHSLVEAADLASSEVRKALKLACQLDGKAAEIVVEEYFFVTEEKFKIAVSQIIDGKGTEVELNWHRTVRDEALRTFDEHALDGLNELGIAAIEKRIVAKRKLMGVLAKRVRTVLNLPIPGKKDK